MSQYAMTFIRKNITSYDKQNVLCISKPPHILRKIKGLYIHDKMAMYN